ncbi:MAG: hypothetical protein ACLS3V_00910 [Streptococcus sp.]
MAFVNAVLSGESAAGAVGWANSEGSYDIIGRAKGIMVVVSMTPFLRGLCQRQVVHLTHSGGGIFQFDYTKYASK